MYDIVKFNGKGKVLQVLECESWPMSKLFCLQNTTGKGQTHIYDSITGELLFMTQGQGTNCFPKVTFDHTLMTMEEYHKKMGPDKVVKGRTH